MDFLERSSECDVQQVRCRRGMKMIQPILQYKSYFLFNIVPILVITISVTVSDDGTESGGCN